MTHDPQYIIEGIILRRLHERRIEGYTIETAKEIAEALAPRCEVLNDDARHVKSALETLCDPLLIKVDGHLVGAARAMAIIDGMREIAQRALLRLPDALAGSAAQASVTRDEIAKIIAPDWFDQYSHCLNNYENQHIRFQNDALERADKIMALLGLSVPSAQEKTP